MGAVKDDRLKYIHQRGEELFEIQIPNGYKNDGSRDRITKTFRGSEDEAIKFRDNLIDEIKNLKKDYIDGYSNSGYTFLEVSKLFISDRSYRKRQGSTTKGYKDKLNLYVLPKLANKKLRNVTENDITELYDEMRQMISKSTGEALSETTIRHVHNIINAIFNYAIHRKWLKYNPAQHIDNKPINDTKEREYYDRSQIKQALENLNLLPKTKNGVNERIVTSQNIRFKTAITILFNTGLRREELFGLKWKDIKYDKHIFEIRRAVIVIKEEECNPEDIIEFVTPSIVCKKLKNEASRRNITVPQVCLDVLYEYRNNQIQNGYPAGDDDYIFQQVMKQCIWNPNYLTKEWNAFVKKFNMKVITIHDIRHSHATDLLSSGVPIQAVSRRLGHSDIATTLKIYVHSNLEQDRLISEKLEEIYNNHYVKNLLNFNVIVSIITGIKFAPDIEIDQAIYYISGEYEIKNKYEELLQKCKDYLLETCSYLKNINLFVTDKNIKRSKAFIELLSNVSSLSEVRPMNSF